jgi:2-oxoisovalerate dehydrogenase E2 component (dihydrolipoyl transacylase)
VAIGHAKWVMRPPNDGTSDPQKRFEVGVSWSADHRVVEGTSIQVFVSCAMVLIMPGGPKGAELAAFVECWRGWVEHPVRMAADGR